MEIGKGKNNRNRRSGHSRKLAKRMSPITAILIAGALIGVGALVVNLFEVYYLDISGDINIDGNIQEVSELYYDTQQITDETTTITTMDYATLAPGDEFTVVHNFDNQDGYDYQITPDLTGMPLEYVDQNNVWYGFEFYVYEHGTTNEVTVLDLDSMANVDVDYCYKVHSMFEQPNPDINFPFLLNWQLDSVVWRILTTSIASGNGAITETPDLARHLDGTTVDIEAVPDAGWLFNGWSGEYTGNDNPYTVTMDTDYTIQASFIEETMTVAIISPIGGETWNKVPNDITWTSTGLVDHIKIEYTENSITTTIIANTENDGVYSWTPTQNMQCTVTITAFADAGESVFMQSTGGIFTIN